MAKRGKYGQGRVYQPKYKDRNGEIKTVSKWYVQYYDREGNQRREPTAATTEKEARTILNTRLYEVEQGTVTTVGSKSLTYGDLRSTIIKDHKIHKKKALEVLSTGEEIIDGMRPLDIFFGFSSTTPGMKVKDITNAGCQEFIDQRRKEGVADSTILNSVKLLKQMFDVAASPEYKLINPSHVPKFTQPKPSKAKQDFATMEEFQKLLGVIDAKFHPYMTWLFFQATRKKEAHSVKWGQLNLTDAMFYPDAEKNKTGDDTPRPLANEVVRVLRGLKKGRPDDPVFSAHSEKMFQKAFRKACYEVKLGRDAWQCSQCKHIVDGPKPGPDDPAIPCDACKKRSKGSLIIPMQYHYVGLTPHGLRRSAVVFYRESGLADSEIMAVTGHKSNKTFLAYSVTRIEQLRKRLDSAAANRTRLLRQQNG